MKIEYITGDAFETDASYILHGCNALGRMGSGFAKTLRALYPQAYQAYNDRHQKTHLVLGEIIVVDCGKHTVINGITQQNFGSDGALYLSYDALADVIREVNELVKPNPGSSIAIPRVAMPKIGSDLAGGDWTVIEKLIEEFSTDFQPVVYILPK